MAAHCARGDSLYADGDLEGAVAAYQTSLQQLLESPSPADSNAKGNCLVGLSSAFLGLEQFEEAVESALQSQEAFTEPCFAALLRQGQAAFHLGEFEAALSAFEAAEVALTNTESTEQQQQQQQQSSHSSSRKSMLRDWIKKTANAAEGAKGSLDMLTATTTIQPDATAAASAVGHGGGGKVPNKKRRSQYSISHYDTKRAVKLTIHAPRVEPGELVYRFSENEVDVCIERADETYRLRFAPAGDIRASHCTCVITPAAVVVRLEKADDMDWNGKLIAERKPLSQVREELIEKAKTTTRQSPGGGSAIKSASVATAASLPNPYSRAKNWDKVWLELRAHCVIGWCHRHHIHTSETNVTSFACMCTLCVQGGERHRS